MLKCREEGTQPSPNTALSQIVLCPHKAHHLSSALPHPGLCNTLSSLYIMLSSFPQNPSAAMPGQSGSPPPTPPPTNRSRALERKALSAQLVSEKNASCLPSVVRKKAMCFIPVGNKETAVLWAKHAVRPAKSSLQTPSKSQKGCTSALDFWHQQAGRTRPLELSPPHAQPTASSSWN